MKKLCIIFILFTHFCYGQTAKNILDKYAVALREVDRVSYNITRIDTFTSGHVWNNQGTCLLINNKQNNLLGFEYVSFRPDIKQTYWYDGSIALEIDQANRTYTVNNFPNRSILGNPGGQMTVPELIKPDSAYSTAKLLSKQGEAYVIQLNFPDDSTDEKTSYYELLHLNPVTFLPSRIDEFALIDGAKRVTATILSNVQVNRSATTQWENLKNVLLGYELIVPPDEHKRLQTLTGKPAPDFSLQSFSGASANLADYRGKVVLLDFWEAWCTPCVEAMPKVQQLYNNYERKGLVVLGITTDKKMIDRAKALVKRKKVTFTNLTGNEATLKQYLVTGFPQYVLIDKSGKMAFVSAGYSKELESAIKENL